MSRKKVGIFRFQAILKNRLRELLIFLLVLGLASVVPGVEANDDHFTNEGIEGEWGFSASGTIVPPAVPGPTLAVAVGIINFYGSGECFFSDTINIGGTSASRTSTECTYAVNPDGSGSISVLFPGDLNATPLSFVIVHDGQEIRFIRTDLGVASGVAKKQDGHEEDDDNDE